MPLFALLAISTAFRNAQYANSSAFFASQSVFSNPTSPPLINLINSTSTFFSTAIVIKSSSLHDESAIACALDAILSVCFVKLKNKSSVELGLELKLGLVAWSCCVAGSSEAGTEAVGRDGVEAGCEHVSKTGAGGEDGTGI
jgi:hypothetical protein